MHCPPLGNGSSQIDVNLQCCHFSMGDRLDRHFLFTDGMAAGENTRNAGCQVFFIDKRAIFIRLKFKNIHGMGLQTPRSQDYRIILPENGFPKQIACNGDS